MDEKCAAENTYIIRPNYQHKFKVGLVKECMRQVLKEELSGQRYTGDSAPQLSASVADCIRKRLEGGRRKKTGTASYNPYILKSIDNKSETPHLLYTDFWEADEGQTGWLRQYYDMGFDRYKFVVQVAIGEQRGQGINDLITGSLFRLPNCQLMPHFNSRMGARCFWDADTDGYAQDIYMNDSLFCVAAAFGCFYY